MSQRDIFYKWLFYALLGLFWLSMQQLICNPLSLWNGVHPFILPMVPVMVAVLERRQESAFFAIACGIVTDLLLSGGLPGFYTVTFLLASLLTGLIAGRVIVSGFLCAFVCSVCALVLGEMLLAAVLSYSLDFTAATALSLAGRELLLSLPFFPLIFLSFRKIYHMSRGE
jgi:biotin transporter BioY